MSLRFEVFFKHVHACMCIVGTVAFGDVIIAGTI